MSEVAKIEGRVRYSAFKKTIKVMISRPSLIMIWRHTLTLILSILVKINIHVTCLVKCHA